MHLLVSLLFLSAILSFIFFGLGEVLKKKSISSRSLQSPFECGFSTMGEHRLNFSLHFFIVALVFIIFDVELIIMFPFFFHLKNGTSMESVFLFIVLVFVLTLALFNEWNQLALEWAH